MNDQSPAPGDAHLRISAEHERARVLAAVLRDQAERAEAAQRAEERRERRVRARRGVLLAVWAGVAYVWVLNPPFVRVQPPPEPTVADEARALRVNMFLQSQKIEAYRMERGRLPFVLQEAGPVFTGMRYRRLDNRFYELVGRSDRVRLQYESERSALDFLGPASSLLDPTPRGGSGP